jgi:hypothetical protein
LGFWSTSKKAVSINQILGVNKRLTEVVSLEELFLD